MPAAATAAAADRLRADFLYWQCRARQIAMRENEGRPNAAMMPTLTADGQTFGEIITVLCKAPPYSRTPEMQHLARQTQDPAGRRNKALEFFRAAYYQKASEFSDRLTATFPPHSASGEKLAAIGAGQLSFDAYGRQFMLECRIEKAAADEPHHEATWWHNALFNPALPGDAIILAFAPDWEKSSIQ